MQNRTEDKIVNDPMKRRPIWVLDRYPGWYLSLRPARFHPELCTGQCFCS